MTWEEIDAEFELLKLYIKYRVNKTYDIYSQPKFTEDSNFYRGLQVHWIPDFENKERWQNELKHIKQ